MLFYLNKAVLEREEKNNNNNNFYQKTTKDLKNQELSLAWLSQLIKNPTSDRNGI